VSGDVNDVYWTDARLIDALRPKVRAGERPLR